VLVSLSTTLKRRVTSVPRFNYFKKQETVEECKAYHFTILMVGMDKRCIPNVVPHLPRGHGKQQRLMNTGNISKTLKQNNGYYEMNKMIMMMKNKTYYY